MKYKYANDEVVLDKSRKEYFAKFLLDHSEDINSGNFRRAIVSCPMAYRAALVQMLLNSGMEPFLSSIDIVPGAFEDSDILEIEIPSNIKFIDYNSFCNSSLKKITFEEGSECQTILNRALADTGIESFTCPDSLWHLDSEVFLGCYNLGYVKLNRDIQSIGAYCFAGTPLKRIYYNGPREIFSNQVDLDDLWMAGCGDLQEIICTDGVIEVAP